MLIGYESIQVYATCPGCPSGASHFPRFQQAPLKKGNSHMDSSVHYSSTRCFKLIWKVGKVVKVGKVGKEGKEGRLLE